MDFNNFLEKQESIYQNFRETSILEREGIISKVPQHQGGYLVAYRHPKEITDSLERFSERVNRITPVIKYDCKNAHTTISDFLVQEDFQYDNGILDKLTKAVHSTLPLVKNVSIDYDEWLLNQNTGIAAGTTNFPFFENAEKIIDYANKNNISLRFPWGPHLTACRFLETEDSPEKISELLNAFKTNKPLGISKPICIDVAHFIFTPEGFDFHTYERFRL